MVRKCLYNGRGHPGCIRKPTPRTTDRPSRRSIANSIRMGPAGRCESIRSARYHFLSHAIRKIVIRYQIVSRKRLSRAFGAQCDRPYFKPDLSESFAVKRLESIRLPAFQTANRRHSGVAISDLSRTSRRRVVGISIPGKRKGKTHTHTLTHISFSYVRTKNEYFSRRYIFVYVIIYKYVNRNNGVRAYVSSMCLAAPSIVNCRTIQSLNLKIVFINSGFINIAMRRRVTHTSYKHTLAHTHVRAFEFPHGVRSAVLSIESLRK